MLEDSSEKKLIQETKLGPRLVKKTEKVKVHLGYTKYTVIKEICQELGWNIVSEDKDWDLLWTDSAVTPEKLCKMKPYQRINHFPGMSALHRKDNLARNLMKLKKHLPEEFTYFPETWLLPREMSDLKACSRNYKATYIIKPQASCQGRGIFLIKNPDQLNPESRYVAQRYIQKPFLLDGLKFDFRVYVLVMGTDPLRIYLYEDGLVRFATETYKSPTKTNLKQQYIHLTNYSINKYNQKFNSTDKEKGHKRSLKSVLSNLKEKGYDTENLLSQIKDIVIKTLMCVQPNLSHIYKACQPEFHPNSICFELLGFDILLDSNFKLWLLEVNHTPSFRTDSEIDYTIKKGLLENTLKLLKLRRKDKRIYTSRLKTKLLKRQLGRSTKDFRVKERKRALSLQEKRAQWEKKHATGFELIYPNSNYEKVQEVSTKLWEDWTGVSKTPTTKLKPNFAFKTVASSRSTSYNPTGKRLQRFIDTKGSFKGEATQFSSSRNLAKETDEFFDRLSKPKRTATPLQNQFFPNIHVDPNINFSVTKHLPIAIIKSLKSNLRRNEEPAKGNLPLISDTQ